MKRRTFLKFLAALPFMRLAVPEREMVTETYVLPNNQQPLSAPNPYAVAQGQALSDAIDRAFMDAVVEEGPYTVYMTPKQYESLTGKLPEGLLGRVVTYE